MDRIMNTHQYPAELIREHGHICAYNAYKEEYIEMISRSKNEERERKKFLVNECPIAPILERTKRSSDGDGQIKQLPDYVVEQITESIGSINLYPSQLTKKVSTVWDDNYVLCVKYSVENAERSIKVRLMYTFDKTVREFEGYFGKLIENECWLPDYEIESFSGGENTRVISIRAHYSNGTYLKVNIEHFSYCLFKETPLLDLDDLPDRQQNCLTNVSLKDAVLRRIFPTKAHYCKHLINEILVKGESDFFNDMALTPLNWVNLSKDDVKYNLYAKYMLTCHRSKKSQPIVDNQLSDEDKIKAMKMIIEEYPFFTIDDDQSETDVCVLDMWINYFRYDLTSEHAREMKLSDAVRNNLTTYCSLDPVKYSKIFELFPSVSFPIVLNDFKRRYDILMKSINHQVNAIISFDNVIHFNRLLKSSIPAKWRLYLCGGTFHDPVHESGQDIIDKLRNGIPAANAIEKVNYLDVENEKHPLSVSQMRTVVAPIVNNLEMLNPEHLEKKFQSYRFSETYKTAPTEMDSLAVRFSYVYKDTDYVVPKIPDDFLDRFNNLEEPVERVKSEFNCVICMKSTKNHMFPLCKHLCVCEFCSYTILKCPLCGQVGNPQKIFL